MYSISNVKYNIQKYKYVHNVEYVNIYIYTRYIYRIYNTEYSIYNNSNTM